MFLYFTEAKDDKLLAIMFWGDRYEHHKQSGPSCSKLTTSLVNDSLKFTSSDTQIC